MKIVPLGVGSAFAKTLNNSNYLITPAQGEPFLLDCGHTASRALSALEVAPRDVSTILVSHLHADHIGGLEEFGFCGYFLWGRKVVLHLPASLMPFLWPQALQAGMGQRLKENGTFIDASLDTYFDVRVLRPRAAFRLGSVEIKPFRTPHVPGRPSWGYRMVDRETGGTALFTCDSRLSLNNLETYGADADLVFHDCQLNGDASAIHAGLSDLLTLDRSWQERTLLVHVDDDWRNYEGKTGAMRFAHEGFEYEL